MAAFLLGRFSGGGIRIVTGVFLVYSRLLHIPLLSFTTYILRIYTLLMPMSGNLIASKGPQSPVIIVWHVTSQGDVLHNKSSARPIHKYSINNAQFIGRGEKGQARNQNNKKTREQRQKRRTHFPSYYYALHDLYTYGPSDTRYCSRKTGKKHQETTLKNTPTPFIPKALTPDDHNNRTPSQG